MKTVLFEITSRKSVEIKFSSLELCRKYPIVKHYLYQYTKIFKAYCYRPDRSMTPESEKEYLEIVRESLKDQYKAYSVFLLEGELERQLQE